jgi:ankyrin repeat protein
MSGQAPIHFAAKGGHVECLRQLIAKQSAVIDSKGQFQQTPLHLAVKHNHFDCVKFLLQRGCSVNAGDEQERTALHVAAWTANLDCVEILESIL